MSIFQEGSPKQTQERPQSAYDEYQDNLTTFTRSDILRKPEARNGESVGSDVTVSSQDNDDDGRYPERR